LHSHKYRIAAEKPWVGGLEGKGEGISTVQHRTCHIISDITHMLVFDHPTIGDVGIILEPKIGSRHHCVKA